MTSLFVLFRVHNPLSWSACAQLKGDDTWCGFTFIYGYVISCRIISTLPPQFSKIWRNILLSLSLPLSLICNCENKSNHLEMRKTIKRDGKLSQSTLWNSEVRKSGSTHDHRTHVHHWKHDMQIRCKIYVIFMHCTEIEKESEHWTIKQRYRHAHTFWFTNRVNGLICIISMKIQFELSLWV